MSDTEDEYEESVGAETEPEGTAEESEDDGEEGLAEEAVGSDAGDSDGEEGEEAEAGDEPAPGGLAAAMAAAGRGAAYYDGAVAAANAAAFFERVPDSERMSSDHLQLTEAAGLLAARAQQIAATRLHFARGDALPDDTTELAMLELQQRRCPLRLRRAVGRGADGKTVLVEIWDVNTMALPDNLANTILKN